MDFTKMDFINETKIQGCRRKIATHIIIPFVTLKLDGIFEPQFFSFFNSIAIIVGVDALRNQLTDADVKGQIDRCHGRRRLPDYEQANSQRKYKYRNK